MFSDEPLAKGVQLFSQQPEGKEMVRASRVRTGELTGLSSTEKKKKSGVMLISAGVDSAAMICSCRADDEPRKEASDLLCWPTFDHHPPGWLAAPTRSEKRL